MACTEGESPKEWQQGGALVSDEEAELAKLQAQLYGDNEEGDGASEDSGGGTAQGDSVEAAGGLRLTKSQMKKRARLERTLAKRAECRQREKAAKAQRRAEVLARQAAELAAMTEEEKEGLRRQKQERLETFRDQERQLKQRLKQSLEGGPRVIIDLDFEKYMTENDIRHLVKQLGFSYAANKQVERPVHMMLTSFKDGVAALANKMISGLDNWYITRTEKRYDELFPSPEDKARLVYLTADAEQELDELDENRVYIIGGIVDHNRHKGLCERLAQASGIATARLPISRHVQLSSREVLTVNHVFQILVEYYARRDWASALDFVMPKRKRADFAKLPQHQDQEQEEERAQQTQDAETGRATAEPAEARSREEAALGAAPVDAVNAEAAPAAANGMVNEAVASAMAEGVGKGTEEAMIAAPGDRANVGETEESSAGRGTKRKADDEPVPAV
ncbi:hypothetical protein Vretimale_18460 [Volvox reticuliferus]|uniref:tRNA (guanine(9)-N(1))-methyltransferase n=1 Tax=Volvox reticuliferus TaxID=1737510 RepID=A0A8J4GY04_9CHLO|nr:hypothetical protein Vretifemale_19793 [Volvox reticuliferus]GIM15758.1 hypothetical protein Vretimale_18460 [Volvox reticuliferus]